jgi:sortase A
MAVGPELELGVRPSRRARGRKRRILRATGNLSIASGVALFAFTAYQLWGTGFITARAQAGLRHELALQGVPSSGLTALQDDPAFRPRVPQTAFSPIPGGAIGFIRIPRIQLDMVFVEGVGFDQLKEGPGHYPQTALPGGAGNVAIAGHRTTYLHPFGALNELRPGDLIELQTRKALFVYQVEWARVLPPSAFWVLARTARPSLTLTTCEPPLSATDRLVVRAVQIENRSPYSHSMVAGGLLEMS